MGGSQEYQSHTAGGLPTLFSVPALAGSLYPLPLPYWPLATSWEERWTQAIESSSRVGCRPSPVPWALPWTPATSTAWSSTSTSSCWPTRTSTLPASPTPPTPPSNSSATPSPSFPGPIATSARRPQHPVPPTPLWNRSLVRPVLSIQHAVLRTLSAFSTWAPGGLPCRPRGHRPPRLGRHRHRPLRQEGPLPRTRRRPARPAQPHGRADPGAGVARQGRALRPRDHPRPRRPLHLHPRGCPSPGARRLHRLLPRRGPDPRPNQGRRPDAESLQLRQLDSFEYTLPAPKKNVSRRLIVFGRQPMAT